MARALTNLLLPEQAWDTDADSESRSAVPIICYYDVERHARDSTPRSRDAVFRTPRDAWNDAWDAKAGLHEFFQWFREREDMENAERVRTPESLDHQLAAARNAIEALLPGYSNPRVHRPKLYEPVGINRPMLTVQKAGHELAFDQLSHGERLLVALAGDIARRLAIANPERNDPLLGEGVVLIDELDLHLHPRVAGQGHPCAASHIRGRASDAAAARKVPRAEQTCDHRKDNDRIGINPLTATVDAIRYLNDGRIQHPSAELQATRSIQLDQLGLDLQHLIPR